MQNRIGKGLAGAARGLFANALSKAGGYVDPRKRHDVGERVGGGEKKEPAGEKKEPKGTKGIFRGHIQSVPRDVGPGWKAFNQRALAGEGKKTAAAGTKITSSSRLAVSEKGSKEMPLSVVSSLSDAMGAGREIESSLTHAESTEDRGGSFRAAVSIAATDLDDQRVALIDLTRQLDDLKEPGGPDFSDEREYLEDIAVTEIAELKVGPHTDHKGLIDDARSLQDDLDDTMESVLAAVKKKGWIEEAKP